MVTRGLTVRTQKAQAVITGAVRMRDALIVCLEVSNDSAHDVDAGGDVRPGAAVS